MAAISQDQWTRYLPRCTGLGTRVTDGIQLLYQPGPRLSCFLEPRPQTPEVPSLCASPKTSLRPPGQTGRALRIPGSALKAPGRLLGPRNTRTCSKTQSRQTILHRGLQLNEVRRHCKRQGSEACSPPAFVAVLQRLWRTREDKKTPAGSRLPASPPREPVPAALDKRLSKLGGARLGASGFCSAPGFGPAVHLGPSRAAGETKTCPADH